MWRQAKSYLLIQPEKPPHYLGHNPLQQLSYTALYAVIIVQIITGFAVYGQFEPGAGWYPLTEVIRPLFGGIQVVRFVHHVLTWVVLMFVPIHVYLARQQRLDCRQPGSRPCPD
jgi:Ni/Fe-hydrogenase 1 B-type cytochrome subunit